MDAERLCMSCKGRAISMGQTTVDNKGYKSTHEVVQEFDLP